MNREELKTMFLQMDCSNIPVKKEIVVEMNKNKEHWIGYGYVSITSDGPDGYSHFATHQEHPMKYVHDRIKESKECQYRDDLSEYKLVIK